MALQLAENPYAVPPDGPRIPRHRNPKDGRPWIRNAGDADPAPDIEWDPDRRIWALPKGNKHRGRGEFLTRASSFGKGLDDPYLRHRAALRKVVFALSRHPELVRAAQAVRTLGDERDEDRKLTASASADRRALEDIADKAEEYGGGLARAMLGTGFHELRHQRDAGVDLSHLDEDTSAALDIWCRVTAPLELVSSEQFVVNYVLGVAGSLDAKFRAARTMAVMNKRGEVMGHLERGEKVIADLKSGWWGMEFAGPCWACQLLGYSGGKPYDHDRGAYDWADGEPSQRWALIVACSPERPEEAGLHWVDLTAARLRARAVPLWRAACERDDLFFAHDEAAQPAEPVAITAGIGLEIDRAWTPDELLDLMQRHDALWTPELSARVHAKIRQFSAVVPAQPLP